MLHLSNAPLTDALHMDVKRKQHIFFFFLNLDFNLYCHGWTQHEKFIQMSTNKTCFGPPVNETAP